MGRKRVARFIALFPEAIDLMVRALRAGLPVTEAIINAGQEIGDPVGTELRGIEAGMRVGRDLDSLLWDIAKRITAPEFRFFIIALSVQRETGGNLAETLNNLSEVLRRRRAMRAKARAMASEARASTMILGSLPIFVSAILSFTSPAYIAPLFTDVRGLMLVGAGAPDAAHRHRDHGQDGPVRDLSAVRARCAAPGSKISGWKTGCRTGSAPMI